MTTVERSVSYPNKKLQARASEAGHAAFAPEQRLGRILSERYRLELLLGQGAMGEVYQAMDLQRREHCAIKMVFPGAALTMQAHRRLAQEAMVITRLYHPNIVEVREWGTDYDGSRYLVMELLRGVDLQHVLQKQQRLPLWHAIEITRSVGAALQYAHDMGVVHRDINPNNIFLSQQGAPSAPAREVVKVLDFGLAKVFEELSDLQNLSAAPITKGIVVGTPAYLPPEAAMAHGGTSDPRSDQWSLAIVLYRMLAGRLPFDRGNVYQLYQAICCQPLPPLRDVVPGIPAHIEEALAVALAKSREDRFASIKDFLRALENLPSIAGSTSGDRAAQTLLEKRTGLTTLLPSLSDEPITLAGPTDASLCLTGLDLLPVSTELLPLPSDIEAGDDDFEAGPSDTLPALPSFCEAEPLDLQKTMQLSAAELQVLADHSRIVADLIPSLATDEAVTIRQAAATHAEVDLRSTLILSTAAAASEHRLPGATRLPEGLPRTPNMRPDPRPRPRPRPPAADLGSQLTRIAAGPSPATPESESTVPTPVLETLTTSMPPTMAATLSAAHAVTGTAAAPATALDSPAPQRHRAVLAGAAALAALLAAISWIKDALRPTARRRVAVAAIFLLLSLSILSSVLGSRREQPEQSPTPDSLQIEDERFGVPPASASYRLIPRLPAPSYPKLRTAGHP